MMNEEQLIKQIMGDKPSFRVPEGYFDNLAARVMDNLPEQQVEVELPVAKKSAKTLILRRVMLAAACVCAVVFSTYILLNNQEQPEQMAVNVVNPPTMEEASAYFDEAADYAMLDNQDIYACLISD
jgi:hypothetical protein